MAEGLSVTAANEALAPLRTNYTWVKLHVGPPGASGTANPAVETTRKQATWNAIAAAAFDQSNALAWTAVAGTEDYTHFSLWTAVTAGVFGHSGLITADAVTAGNNFTIPAGGLDIAFPTAS